MISRVTGGYMKDMFLRNISRQSADLEKLQSQISSQRRINLPSDDVAGMINYMKWESQKQDTEKFNGIISSYTDKMNIIDGYLESVTSSLQRARELTVQAANGIYTKDERTAAAMEIDQIIRQLVADANSEYKGNAIFSGTAAVSMPYRITEESSEDVNGMLVSSVSYFGNSQDKVMDIGRNDRIISVMPGNSVFETTATVIQGTADVSGYISPSDSAILIQGVQIPVMTGDNLETIAQKINDSNLGVSASVETTANGEAHFRITSTAAGQPWLQDLDGGSVLQDLGISDADGQYSANADTVKQSIFDTLINLKNDLLKGDTFALGGADLGRVDQSLGNVIRYRAYSGAVAERLQNTYDRNANELVYLANSASKVMDINNTQAITDMKMAEFAQQAALNIGAKLMPRTLMDFLH